MSTKIGMKRFTLSIPQDTHEKLAEIANQHGVSLRDIMLKSLKLGLLAISLDDEPNKELVIKEVTENSVKETKLLLI